MTPPLPDTLLEFAAWCVSIGLTIGIALGWFLSAVWSAARRLRDRILERRKRTTSRSSRRKLARFHSDTANARFRVAGIVHGRPVTLTWEKREVR